MRLLKVHRRSMLTARTYIVLCSGILNLPITQKSPDVFNLSMRHVLRIPTDASPVELRVVPKPLILKCGHCHHAV